MFLTLREFVRVRQLGAVVWCASAVAVALLLVAVSDAADGSATRYMQFQQGPHSHQYVEQEFDSRVFFDDDLRQSVEVRKGFTNKDAMCVLFGVCAAASLMSSAYGQQVGLTTVFEWQRLEFDYASDAERNADLASGVYVEEVATPIDMDVHYAGNNMDRVFVAIPRFAEGIPVTLGVVTPNKRNGNPIIAPYPDWSWQRNSELCKHERIISVFRIKIDECSRLWVLDAGRIGDKFLCSPQIMAFDLNTNTRLHHYELPSDQYEPRSIFVTPIVDIVSTQYGCRNTVIYMADVQGFSIVVYDTMRQKSWRIIDKTFYPFPSFGTFTIENESFDLMDGILGMDLTPKVVGQDRRLIYHALASQTENWVWTSHLKNFTLFEHDPSAAPHLFNTYPNTRSSQSAAIAIDKYGIAYFGNMADTTIMCWNTALPYGGYNLDILEKNAEKLQFPSGMKVIINRKGGEELWTMTTSFQKVMQGTLRQNAPNFRILAGKTSELLFGKRCAQGINVAAKPTTSTSGSGRVTTRRPGYGK